MVGAGVGASGRWHTTSTMSSLRRSVESSAPGRKHATMAVRCASHNGSRACGAGTVGSSIEAAIARGTVVANRAFRSTRSCSCTGRVFLHGPARTQRHCCSRRRNAATRWRRCLARTSRRGGRWSCGCRCIEDILRPTTALLEDHKRTKEEIATKGETAVRPTQQSKTERLRLANITGRANF